MDHVASVPSATSGRMQPEAMGLALLLHAVMALALWWLAAHRPVIEPRQDPVEISFEQPKPPDPPKPPPPEPQKPPPPQAMTPPVESIPPPAEEADKAEHKRASGEAQKDVAAAPPDSVEKEVPAPSPPPPLPVEAAKPEPTPAPLPPEPKPAPEPKPTEMAAARPEALPPPPPPPPPRPQPQPAPQAAPPKPPPPAVTTVQPQPHPQPPKPPPALSPRPQPQPSPLTSRQTHQPPAVARREEAPSSSTFVNPANEKNRATAEQNYLWEVVRKLRGYRYHANVPMGMEGLTVVQVVIGRDGRLLSAQIVRSSGVPAMDQGVLNGVRQGSPYTPLPASVTGPSATFRLPLVSVPDR